MKKEAWAQPPEVELITIDLARQTPPDSYFAPGKYLELKLRRKNVRAKDRARCWIDDPAKRLSPYAESWSKPIS